MRDDPGHERGKNHGVVELSEIEHFYAEERAGNRRTEDRSETSADAADHQSTPVLVAEVQHIGE